MRSVKRGSYFFVIDALIAGMIILGSVALMYGEFLERPQESTALYSAEDFLTTMESTEVRRYDSELLRNWTFNGTINDSGRSMLEQLAHFYGKGMSDEQGRLSQILIQNVPTNVNMELYLNGDSAASRALVDKNESGIFFSSKRIILIDEGPTQMMSPVIIEVQTWQ